MSYVVKGVFWGFFEYTFVIYTAVVIAIAILSFVGKSGALAAIVAYTAFVAIAMETGYGVYVNLTYFMSFCLSIYLAFLLLSELFGGGTK